MRPTRKFRKRKLLISSVPRASLCHVALCRSQKTSDLVADTRCPVRYGLRESDIHLSAASHQLELVGLQVSSYQRYIGQASSRTTPRG